MLFPFFFNIFPFPSGWGERSSIWSKPGKSLCVLGIAVPPPPSPEEKSTLELWVGLVVYSSLNKYRLMIRLEHGPGSRTVNKTWVADLREE